METTGKIILEELHKLWKHHASNLKDLYQRKENPAGHNYNINIIFIIGQPVMIKNHVCHTSNPNMYWTTRYYKYVMTTILLITPNGKERKTIMSNLAAQQNLLKCFEFISELNKTKCKNYSYSLRLHPNSKFKV